jgi:hypothetical protein
LLNGTFTDASGGVYSYATTQTAKSGTYAFKTPSSANPNITYSADWVGSNVVNNVDFYDDYTKRVSSANINGNIWTYSYINTWDESCIDVNCDAYSSPFSVKVTATDPLSQVKTYNDTSIVSTNFRTKSISPILGSEIDELGYTWSYGWQADGQPNLLTMPEGNSRSWSYDSRGNNNGVTDSPKPNSGASATSVNAVFSATCSNPVTCSKPLSTTTANGNETDYTYDPNHGGVLSEMRPAPTLGAPRPLKLTAWVQKYAYYLNASGALVASSAPVWVVSSETQCQTLAGSNSPVCDSSAPKKVTTYEYGADRSANNLLVRGVVVAADGSSRRTCRGYDKFGNEISQTTPRAGLSVCP